MAKKIKCPSCETEIFAGKYCLECGVELETEDKAVFSEDVLETLSERITEKVIKRLQATEPKPTEGGDDGTKKEGTGGADSATSKAGRFFRK